jgi:CheY-like chemotaxis protein
MADAIEPAAGSAESTKPVASTNRGGQAVLRVLVVDNEIRFITMIRGLLDLDGHWVVTASESRTAIAVAEGDPLDVAILDLSMPGMNGWQLAEELRRRQPALGIVLCTGWGRELAEASIERQRVDFVLAKPFRLADLRLALREAYRLSRCRRDALNSIGKDSV